MAAAKELGFRSMTYDIKRILGITETSEDITTPEGLKTIPLW